MNVRCQLHALVALSREKYPRVPTHKKRGETIADLEILRTESNPFLLYVQVTVHRDNCRINNQQDASSIQNFILSRNM
jgi:hypothetical protein